MQKNLKKRSDKAGLPPGSLIHIGDLREQPVRVSRMLYDGAGYSEWEGLDLMEKELPSAEDKVLWIHLDGVHQPDMVRVIGELYGIHTLTMEDILNTEHPPKVDETDEGLFLIVKKPAEDRDGSISFRTISILLGDFGVISFTDTEEDPFSSVRTRIKGGAGKIRKKGRDYLVYALLDTVVDSYFTVIDRMQEEILQFEEVELHRARPESLERLLQLQRKVLRIRQVVRPIRDMVATLCRIEDQLIHESTRKYFEDTLDHIKAVSANIDHFRELLTSMMDLHISMVNTRMNQVVKLLTVFAAVFMPLTFIAGLYGMNFKNMPELNWRYGYFIILAGMAMVAVAMMLFFRRKKWL